MCGFLSYIKSPNLIFPDFTNSKQILRRRGPDFQDDFYSDNFYCYHSRLSIIDLDNKSNQPFFSKCSRYLIIYNGEIYNLKNLREYLIINNVYLKTNSDTEVILELYLLEGDICLSRLKGMFSFFIWDMQKKAGFAARDPYGIKPLYYYEKDGVLIFSSQLKAITAIFNFNNQFSSKALNDFYLLGSISELNTIFNGINCFKAGYKMSIKENKIVNYISWSNILEHWVDKISTNTNNQNKDNLPGFVNLQLLNSVKLGQR
jgi:asparagine synthase (glutamine-hydrolysing)